MNTEELQEHFLKQGPAVQEAANARNAPITAKLLKPEIKKYELRFDLNQWLFGINWGKENIGNEALKMVAVHFGPVTWMASWYSPRTTEELRNAPRFDSPSERSFAERE